MANINKITKWDLARDFTNTWLRDPTLYCNNCDCDYSPVVPKCCDNPQIGDNLKHTYSLVRALKDIRATRENEFAANKSKTMRWGISLPPRLYHALDRYFMTTMGEKLFVNQYQMRQFAKKFPEFKVPERI